MPSPAFGPVLPLFPRLVLAGKQAEAARFRQFCRAREAARLLALRAAARRRTLRRRVGFTLFALVPLVTTLTLRLAGLA